MTSNCQCNMQYIPYKKIVKQKAREYYHKNEEYKREQKISIIHYHLKKERNDKNTIKNGLKNNQLKNNKN